MSENKTAFTPAPWFAVDFGGFHILKSQDFYDVGVDLLNEDKCNQAKQNAQLAAAAPDLLEALLIAKNEIEVGYQETGFSKSEIADSHILGLINSAISKATAQ